MIIDKNLDCLNFAEAYLGRITLEDRTLIVPAANLHLLAGGTSKLLSENIGNVIQFAYVIFDDVDGITWDYAKSRLLDESKRICIGGDFLDNGKHTEFWFEHSGGKICTYEVGEIIIRESSFNNLELRDLGLVEKLSIVPSIELLTRK